MEADSEIPGRHDWEVIGQSSAFSIQVAGVANELQWLNAGCQVLSADF